MPEMKYNGWRPVRGHKPPHHMVKDMRNFRSEDALPIPATRFLDQVSFIGNEFVGCFVVETGDGLLLIDCMEPSDTYVGFLDDGLKELGLDLKDIKNVLITHGHHDHYGFSNQLREKYGCKLYMSKRDEEFAQDPNTPRAPGQQPLAYSMDGYLDEGDVFRQGNIEVKVYATPGHTPGGLSYIFNVSDEGRPHKAALWGGTGIPRSKPEQEIYLASAKRFVEICREEKVDVEISTHPFVDQSGQRLAICRDIVDGVPNPFVIGEEAVIRYHEMFVQMCLNRMQG